MVISVKGTYTVTPAKETPRGLIYVSELDQIAPKTHAPLIYFFQRPPSDPFQTIKHSLGELLSIFYPLAGRLQWSRSTSRRRRRLEINCNTAGAVLVEAESDSAINGFGDFCPTAAVTELLPPIDYNSLSIEEQPLLLVQFTRFSCGGISLGLRISHVLVDGVAISHFVSEWARVSRGEEPLNLPFLDRTVLKPQDDSSASPGYNHSDLFKTPLLIGQASNLEERRKETTPAMLRLSKAQVEILKSNANNNVKNLGGRPYTTFEVVSAHMWRCACKARGHKHEQQTVLRFPVNIRNRIQPNLPKWYFGNGYIPVPVPAIAGELLAEPLSHACGKIREAIVKVNDEYLKSSLSYFKSIEDPTNFSYSHVVGSEEGPFFGNPILITNSWLSLSLHGHDFGWGKDIYMGPGLVAHDGRSFMLHGRVEEGSIVVALRLQVAHIDAFKKFFYSDDILRTKL